MALVIKDRIKETATTTGTGTFTLGGAISGFQAFSEIGNGNTTYYCIEHQTQDEFEVGLGTYTLSGTTLARTTIITSSNAGNAVNFSAGDKNVFVTVPATKTINKDASNNIIFDALSVTGDLTVDTNTLYVNSTNNRVGIGTTSADEVLEVSGDIKSSGSNFGIYHFGETSDVTKIVGRDAGHAVFPNIMDFFTNSTLRMRIDSSGNVKINGGTLFPESTDSIRRTVDNSLITISGGDATNSGANYTLFGGTHSTLANIHRWRTDGSERMRIDSSGNLLVGRTSASSATAGFTAQSDGAIYNAYAGRPYYVNRLSSDGKIIEFAKDGTTVASIDVASSDNVSFSATTGGGAGLLFFGANGTAPTILPMKENAVNDGETDLGRGANRFQDLFLSGSVYLGGTGSANALDDYEEGTFTVTLLTTGSPNPTYTIGNTTGYYTKVGRLVTANFYSGAINISNAGSGAARISGLPFNANTTTYGQYSVVSFTHTTAFTSNAEGGITLGGSTQIAVYAEGTTSSIAFTTGSPLYMMFTVTYWTD